MENIKLIEPNYNGIASVLIAFAELYKAGANKEMLDKALSNFIEPKWFVDTDNSHLKSKE